MCLGEDFLKQILDILHWIYTHPETQSTPEWHYQEPQPTKPTFVATSGPGCRE